MTGAPAFPAAARTAPPAWLPWVTWGLGASLFCYGFFQRVAPSVMIDHLMRDFAVGGALLGNLSALYFYAYAGLQVPVGLMVDRWGARRLLTGGALLCALGSLIFARADGLGAAYAGRLLIGAGAGFGFVATLKLATSWFPPRRFALVSGLTIMIGMLGGMAGQAPLAALVETAGWRGTLLGAAGLGALLGLAIWLVVRDRPDGAEAGAAAPGPGAGPGPAASFLAACAAVFGRGQNWILALVCAAMTAPMLAFGALWGVAWLMQTRGLERPAAALAASLVLLGWALGGPLIGALSDRIGRRKPLLLAGTALSLATLSAALYLPEPPLALLSALLLLNGVGSGAMVIGFAATREGNPGHLVGAAYSIVNCAVVATGAVFQPLVGWLLDQAWDGAELAGARVYSEAAYQTALSSIVAFLAVGLAAGLFLRETGPGRSRRDRA